MLSNAHRRQRQVPSRIIGIRIASLAEAAITLGQQALGIVPPRTGAEVERDETLPAGLGVDPSAGAAAHSVWPLDAVVR